MLFNSYIFILLFFPLCLAVFCLLESRRKAGAAKIWLILCSFWFYGYSNPYHLVLLLGSIAINYGAFRLLWRLRGKGAAKAVLALGICLNLGALFYFKYYDFFAENINRLFGSELLLKNILLPLGISYFTFQQIGFLVDTYRGETGRCGIVEYALFVSFFPRLVAGPIVTFGEMIPQFQKIGHREFSWEQMAKGLYLFTLGLGKKVLLADTFGAAVDFGYGSVASLNGTDAVLVMLFYTIQLYFDFSGYCDMARGTGHMLGIEIPVNFNSPYKASDPIEFWKRWHITLNRFLLKYVYIPLGGNRKGRGRMYCNLMLVFLVSGLWHGAGWTFLLWGALHGIVYAGARWVQQKRKRTGAAAAETVKPAGSAVGHAAGVILTFLFLNVSWVFFRSESLSQAGALFARMVRGGFDLPSQGIYDVFNLGEFWYPMKVLGVTSLPGRGMYLCAAFTLFALGILFFCRNAGEMEERFSPKASNLVLTSGLFLWCVLSLSGVSSFLYFKF